MIVLVSKYVCATSGVNLRGVMQDSSCLHELLLTMKIIDLDGFQIKMPKPFIGNAPLSSI